MTAFVPIATHALYVPFDSAFIYLGYLPDLYIVPESDEESNANGNFFSIGRLCLPFHRSFGIGVRKPRLISNTNFRHMKYMGTVYLLSEVKCLNIKHSIHCWFSSRLPINQSEIEKVMILGKICEQIDNYNSKDSPLEEFLFSNFLIAGTNRSWGEYMCFTTKDQEAILSCVSDRQKMIFSMMPIENFYKSSIESSYTDLQKDSLWSARLSVSFYAFLGKIYRS